MMRNSNLYHRLWYLRKRGAKRLHIYFRLLLVFIIFALAAVYANKTLLPSLADAAGIKAKSTVDRAVEEAVSDVFSGYGGYEDFVELHRDAAGRLISIYTDVIRLNKLSAELSAVIRQKLASPEIGKVAVPLGSLLGNSIFAGFGPEFKIAVRTEKAVAVNYVSELSDAGINQTRHSLYLTTQIEVKAVAPGVAKKITANKTIPVAETVIVGEVPPVYFNTKE